MRQTNETNDKGPETMLSWRRMDPEQKVGLRGAKYTDANLWLALVIGTAAVGIFYATIVFVVSKNGFTDSFLDRPSLSIPFLITFFAAWSLAFLFLKWRKLRLQQRALLLEIVPNDPGFVLSAGTAPSVLEQMYRVVDDPKRFVLFNRIERALSNLRNIGRVSDVTEMLRAQAQNDEDQMASSYTVVKGFIWGIPVLGFIGTVLGLSIAIGTFGELLKVDSKPADASSQIETQGVTQTPQPPPATSSADVRFENLTKNLQGVTAGLSTAFETTLQGLVAALVIQLLLVALRKKEECFLDDCKEYCHAHIIGRLRLMHLDGGVASSEQD
ncbi:MAG: MotA/TolQ/ExbB proton channel family protein [Calditrichaeota bacterium]|nr:MotA/TolQ/ExbB proton channel family protein [Calditrichota bacterium]